VFIVLSRAKNGRGVKFTTPFYLVTEVKNAWSYHSTPPIVDMDIFTFT